MGVFCLIWRFTTTLQSQCLQAYFYICVRSTFTGLQLKYFIWINPALPQFMANINLEPEFLNEHKFSDYERKFYSWDHCSENNRLLLIIFNFKRWRSTFNSKYNLTVKKCWICQYSNAHIPVPVRLLGQIQSCMQHAWWYNVDEARAVITVIGHVIWLLLMNHDLWNFVVFKVYG